MWKVVFLLGFCLLCAYATANLLGGFEDANLDDEDVLTAAGHATQALSKQFAGKYHHKLVKVLKAKKQVVAGMNYKLDIVVGKTNCDKKEVEYENVKDCELQDGISTYKKCSVIVYKDLNDSHKLVASGCILTSKKDL